MEFADKLLSYKNNRSELIELLKNVYHDLELHYPLPENEEDICPFTVFGCFNKGISNKNRIDLMKAIGSKLDVKSNAPMLTECNGIPYLNNLRARFFGDKSKRKQDDIPNLWNVFETGINYAVILPQTRGQHL